MKILVLSDTHMILKNLDTVLDYENGNFDKIIHLGDCVSDVNHIKNLCPDKEIFSVCGNCDFTSSEKEYDILDINGVKIYICHGHKHDVKFDYLDIIEFSKSLNVNICLFGHTHYPELFYKEGILFLNPGSLSLPRGIRVASYGFIEILENGEIYPILKGLYKTGIKILDK